MNKVYEGPGVTIHDDREPLTVLQAIDILLAGGSVNICYPPDYSEDEPVYDDDYPIYLIDIIDGEKRQSLSAQQADMIIYEYLRGYEIYRS